MMTRWRAKACESKLTQRKDRAWPGLHQGAIIGPQVHSPSGLLVRRGARLRAGLVSAEVPPVGSAVADVASEAGGAARLVLRAGRALARPAGLLVLSLGSDVRLGGACGSVRAAFTGAGASVVTGAAGADGSVPRLAVVLLPPRPRRPRVLRASGARSDPGRALVLRS
jgi:hypothetical protein